MIQNLGNKLQVQIEGPNSEKIQNINFQNVKEAPEESAILELGDIMTELALDESYLKGGILTSQKRYSR